MQTIGGKIIEAADAFGDMIVNTLGSWLDRGTAAMREKGGQLLGSLGSSFSEGLRATKTSIGNAITPNGIGKSKASPSPSIERAQSLNSAAPAVSAPTKTYGDMLQSAGFSMDSVGSIGAEATDLGNTSVGIDNVGCVAQGGVRAMATDGHYR